MNSRHIQQSIEKEKRIERILWYKKVWMKHQDIADIEWTSRYAIDKFVTENWLWNKVDASYKYEIEWMLERWLTIKNIADHFSRDRKTIREHIINLWINTELYKRWWKVKTERDELIVDTFNKYKNKRYVSHILWLSINTVTNSLKMSWITKDEAHVCWKCYTLLPIWKQCKWCRKESMRIYKERKKMRDTSNIESFVVYKAKMINKSAQIRWLEYDLDEQYILDLYNATWGLCWYTWEKMEFSGKNLLSADRFDNTKWYIKWNIILCTWFINTCKSSMSLDEFQKYMPTCYEKWMMTKNIYEKSGVL